MKKKLVSRTIPAVITILYCAVLSMPAHARTVKTRGAVYHCGIVTCSLYISRSETRRLWNRLSPYANSGSTAIAAAAGIACSPAGGVGAAVCGGAAKTYGAFFLDKLRQAANARQCLRMRHLPGSAPLGVGTVNALYVDRSGYCKN